VVLLFESKPRWNVVGGREILTTENHNGEGCNVAFVDTHVEFVQTEDLGSLKWTVEETADDPNGQ
jgi:prepilin-type processing-associated H-X9-DG protein